MKDNLRFVDSDMHVMEPADLFQRYLVCRLLLEKKKSVGSDGKPRRGPIIIVGLPATGDLHGPHFVHHAVVLFLKLCRHAQQPPELVPHTLLPRSRDRAVLPVRAGAKPRPDPNLTAGHPATRDLDIQQYRKPTKGASTHTTQ